MDESEIFVEPFPKIGRGSKKKKQKLEADDVQSLSDFDNSMKQRKRKFEDDDAWSVADFDTSVIQDNSFQKKKRMSLASLLSPVSQVKRVGTALQKSVSGIRMSPANHSFFQNEKKKSPSLKFKSCSLLNLNTLKYNRRNSITTYSNAKPVCPRLFKQRMNRLWIDTLPYASLKHVKEKFSDQEICHQETIYELLQGEEDIVEDLTLVQQIYHDSLFHLKILTSSDLQQIFGCFQQLIPLHQALVNKLKTLQEDFGCIHSIGETMLSWVSGLKAYETYCSNLIRAKDLLDERKSQDRRLEDFLQRCLESPFSRRLDLWNFLDVPRNRLVKYPLLLQQILKKTPEHNIDKKILPKVIKYIEEIIKEVDCSMGQANCKFILEKLDFIYPQQKNFSVEDSLFLLCSGVLRNKRGTKLHAFLFNNAFVLARKSTRYANGFSKTLFQVYQEPIPTSKLQVIDLKDGEARIGGSFQNAFSSNGNAEKHIFAVSCIDEPSIQGRILQADSEHNKKQWMKQLMELSRCSSQEANCDGAVRCRPILKERNCADQPECKSKSVTSTADPNKIITRSSSKLAVSK